MSKILYCRECSQALHNEKVVVDSSGWVTKVRTLMYCLNEDCSRYGLLSMMGQTKPKKSEL